MTVAPIALRSPAFAAKRHHLGALALGSRVVLQAAGLLKVVHLVEGVGDGAARGQQAVMAQDHGVVVAEDQPIALVRDRARCLRGRGSSRRLRTASTAGAKHQALLLRRHSHADRGVAVHDALRSGDAPW